MSLSPFAFEVTLKAHAQVVKIEVNFEKADLMTGEIVVTIEDTLGNNVTLENPSLEEMIDPFLVTYNTVACWLGL